MNAPSTRRAAPTVERPFGGPIEPGPTQLVGVVAPEMLVPVDEQNAALAPKSNEGEVSVRPLKTFEWQGGLIQAGGEVFKVPKSAAAELRANGLIA